jgi:hypothetical protein
VSTARWPITDTAQEKAKIVNTTKYEQSNYHEIK